MIDTAPLSRAFDIQAAVCADFGAAFSGALLREAAKDIAAGGPVLGLLAPWEGQSTRDLFNDATPVRWLGALHDLVLSGEAEALAAAYPATGRPGDPATAWSAAREAMIARPQRFAAFMSHEPQTNEVRRSACLLPGFLTIAGTWDLPLRIFEIGASAGLNQQWDRFSYNYGDAGRWGDEASPVRLGAEWRGAPAPLGARVRVAERAACDRKPVDIRDQVARRRLMAYVWAGQPERLERLQGAIAMALAAEIRVEAEDAVTWVARRAAPAAGFCTVVYHSIFWQYMPPESQAAARAAIEAQGAAATAASPFAWLRMEPPPENLAIVELRLTIWPGGEEHILGLVHPHGAFVDWRAPV